MTLTCVNESSHVFQCVNGNCINATLMCNGHDNCGDGSDEDPAHALCHDPSSFELTGALIAAIVIGGIVGIVILCCVLGTIVDCVMHVYKYWCNCLHKAYHYQAEMVSLRGTTNTQSAQTQTVTPSGSEPAIPLVVVRAIPPNYDHVVVSCDSSSNSSNALLSGSSNSGYRAVPARSPTEARLPPSYSSLFRNDYVTYVAEGDGYQATEAFLAPPR